MRAFGTGVSATTGGDGFRHISRTFLPLCQASVARFLHRLPVFGRVIILPARDRAYFGEIGTGKDFTTPRHPSAADVSTEFAPMGDIRAQKEHINAVP